MSFVIKNSGDFVSIICREGDKALTYVPSEDSLSNKPEYYISNSSATHLDEPYYDIEQALDDFEYITSKLPVKLVNSFKNKSSKTCIEVSSMTDEFTVEKDGEFCNLINNTENCQLSFYPASETLTGEPEYIITDTSYEPLQDFEILAESFTTEFEEAIQMFEDVIGTIPIEYIDKFKAKIKSSEQLEED